MTLCLIIDLEKVTFYQALGLAFILCQKRYADSAAILLIFNPKEQ